MRVTRFQVSGVRRLESVSLEPGPVLNLFVGDNGAGKSSLLEALHLMAYGRSFRGRVRDGLVRTGAEAVEIFVEWSEGPENRLRRAGLRHTGQTWNGRLDGATVTQLGELCAALAVVSFEPGSHALITGGGDTRRRFVDWGLFHVEQEFMPIWRRYARGLKQRNAVLKTGGSAAQLDAWDHELAEAGERLTDSRERYLEQLEPVLRSVAAGLVPSLGNLTLDFVPGWRRSEMSLMDAYLLARERDRMVGYTTVGPHRGDWRVGYSELPQQEPLSRGQAKLTALSCLLAQAMDFAGRRREWPIIALDDLPSELDRRHQQRVLEWVLGSGAQLFITSTEPSAVLQEMGVDPTLFHVEQGAIHPA